MKTQKRPSDINQQSSTAVRPPLPRDGSMDGCNRFTPGKIPHGGLTTVWGFGPKNTKDSSTSKPGNAGGKRII